MNEAQLKKLTIKDLKTLIAKAQSTIEAKQQEAVEDLREKYRAMAEDAGIEFDLVLGKSNKGKSARAKPAIKYRDPNNPENTWTGMGRMATWLMELKKKGEDIEKYRI